MRILLVTLATYPRATGVGTYLKELQRGLRRRGHTVNLVGVHPRTHHFYMPGTSWHAPQPLPPTVRRRRLGWTRRARALARALAAALPDYDIVHAMDPYSTQALRPWMPGPLVMTLHGLPGRERRRPPGAEVPALTPRLRGIWRLEEAALRAADITLVPSRWLYGHIHHHLPQDEAGRLRVLPYGVDVQAFDARLARVRSVARIPGRPMLLCAGRLVPYKGQRDLLAALGRLKWRHRRMGLWLVGRGRDRRALTALTRRLGLSGRVRLTGHRPSILPWLRAADVVVVPSRHDNQPFTVIEAQLAGKPLVATRVGGIVEMVREGQTGLLVSPRAPAQLAAAVARLLDEPHLRRDLGQQARLAARVEWEAEAMLAGTLEAYRDALDRRSPGAGTGAPAFLNLSP